MERVHDNTVSSILGEFVGREDSPMMNLFRSEERK
jgi:hypothetical protein